MQDARPQHLKQPGMTSAIYAGGMFRPLAMRFLPAVFAFMTIPSFAQTPDAPWNFAVSGDSRNCGDFVMPAIAAATRAEHDAFYWHLGDFRWGSQPDQDMVAMLPSGKQLSIDEYRRLAWDDFLVHQIPPFGTMPVFLGRGNHAERSSVESRGLRGEVCEVSRSAGNLATEKG